MTEGMGRFAPKAGASAEVENFFDTERPEGFVASIGAGGCTSEVTCLAIL
jgi:hypothetical protein